MKTLLIVLLFSLSIIAHAQQPLTNADVISLIKSGLSADIVSAKIKQSGGSFDTSPAKLKELKAASVPESVILAMIESGAPSKPVEQPRPVEKAPAYTQTLKDGTPIELELAYTVSSADLKEGDIVNFLVVQPVRVDGVKVIEKGAPAVARVVKAEGGKSWGRGGNLTWAIQHVTAIDGQRLPLHFTDASKGNGTHGATTTGIVVTSILFWPAAPLWGFKKGKPAVIPGGKRFEVYVHGDAAVNVESQFLFPPKQNGSSVQTVMPPTPVRSGPCYQNGKKVPCS